MTSLGLRRIFERSYFESFEGLLHAFIIFTIFLKFLSLQIPPCMMFYISNDLESVFSKTNSTNHLLCIVWAICGHFPVDNEAVCERRSWQGTLWQIVNQKSPNRSEPRSRSWSLLGELLELGQPSNMCDSFGIQSVNFGFINAFVGLPDRGF